MQLQTEDKESSGYKIALFLHKYLSAILRRESAEGNQCYYYRVGDYYLAFNKSAYVFSQLDLPVERTHIQLHGSDDLITMCTLLITHPDMDQYLVKKLNVCSDSSHDIPNSYTFILDEDDSWGYRMWSNFQQRTWKKGNK